MSGINESKLNFTSKTLQRFIDLMPYVVSHELSEVCDTLFHEYCYHRPDLIAHVKKFATCSPDTTHKIDLFAKSLNNLQVDKIIFFSGVKEHSQDVLEMILTPHGRQLLSLSADVASLKAARLIGNYCNQVRELELRTNGHNHASYLDLILPKAGNSLRKLGLNFNLSCDTL